MKKLLVLTVVLHSLLGCKDEFNIPESESYIDGDAPQVIALNSPVADSVYTNVSSIPIQFTVKDNYFLSSIEVEIRDVGNAMNAFVDTVYTTDSIYDYSSTFSVTPGNQKNYELYITARDEVLNPDYTIVSFSTQ